MTHQQRSTDEPPTSGADHPTGVAEALVRRDAAVLASYAMHGIDSAGRKHREPSHPYRSPFQRDRDRIVHSAAYRRLSNKMQVFTGELGDYHRTRLTHTLEVASVARTIGRALRLNEDLIEALALAHDIGHPPFGHAGEQTLDECLASDGGFGHNRQALRIVEQLEQRYPDFPGLNLTIEVLDGQAARIAEPAARVAGQATGESPLLEAQVVDTADSIAYDTHDADDALQLGLLVLDELSEVPLWRETVARVRVRWSNLDRDQLKQAVIHELIDWQVGDVLQGARERLAQECVDGIKAVRRAPILIRPSAALAEQKQQLEQFLFDRVYRHPQVLRMRRRAQEALRQMFDRYVEKPELLPPRFGHRCRQFGVARSVGDYLAGMTDRFAMRQFGCPSEGLAPLKN